MKKKFFLIALLFVATACNQQQEPKGQTVPGMMPPRSPEEIRQLQIIASSNPKNADGWILLGDALMDANRCGEAVDAYQKGLALDPKNVNAIVDMGTCYRSIKQPKLAAEQYRKALKLNPNHANANRNLGVVLAYDLNDKKGAMQAFEKYLQVAPTAADAADIRQMVSNMKSNK